MSAAEEAVPGERRPRVLYLIDTLETGGAEQSLLALLQRFRRVLPVVCHVYPGDALRPDFERAGIRVVSLGVEGRYGFASAVQRFSRLVRAERPDLIHATLFRADIVARVVARRTGIPLVDSFVNDSYAASRWEALPALSRAKLRVVQALDAFTARWVTHFTAISNTVRASNARALGLRQETISVIYRGRDPDRYLPAGASRRAAKRDSLGLAPDAPVFLNVARLLDRKGQLDLLAAFSELLQRHPACRLLLVGDGPHRARIEAEVDRLALRERVGLLGTRTDVPELLQMADAFVFPSHYEGLGGSLLEAMMAGIPIVATDIPVHRESVERGVTARLVPVARPQALAAELIWVVENPSAAREMGERARAVARERFDIDRIAALQEALYLEVLGRTSVGRRRAG